MSLTRPTDFELFSAASGEQLDVIVSVSDGTDTWYFSARPMPAGLNTSPVYPMLMSHSKIAESTDIYSKRFSVSGVTVTLSNLPYYPAAGERPKRASDLIGGCNGGSLKIWQMAGSDITDIADCMLVFSGDMITCPAYDKHKVIIQAVDKSKLLNVTLPKLTVNDKWGNAPATSKTISIPIVYGKWNVPDPYVGESAGTGMLRGIIVEDDQTPAYLMADHECNTIDDIHYILSGLPVAIGYAADAYSGAQGHFVVGNITNVIMYFPLSSNLPGIYDHEGCIATDPEYAYDDDTNTRARLTDNVYDDGTSLGGRGLWAIADDLIFRKCLATGNPSIKIGYKYLDLLVMATQHILAAYLYYYHNGGDQAINIGQGSGGELIYNNINTTFLPAPDPNPYVKFSDLGDNLSDEFAIGFFTDTNDGGDGVKNNQYIIDVGEILLRLTFEIDETQEYCWSSGQGKEYGSWIDDGARSNSYNAGDVIEDPVSIVEDIFRSSLGLVDADIDVASFDNALNSSVKSRIDIIKTAKAYNIVRTISEQSTFMVFYSGAGKLHAIPLNDRNPTITAVIPRDRIVNDSIEVSKTGTIVNKMEIKSRWYGERDKFLDTDTYEDTVSQSDIQSERAGHYQWQNVVDSSAEHVAEHLVNSTNGLWSKQHVKVKFSTPGFTYSYLQPGDWIKLDPDVDDMIKPYGESWEGKRLLIVETSKDMKSTEITAIEIYSPLLMFAASLTLAALPLTVVVGAKSISMSSATLVSSAQALTVTPGAASIQMSPATLASSAETSTVVNV